MTPREQTQHVVDRWLTSTQPAVIFDFNGTLSDDEGILLDIYGELFAAHLNWQLTPAQYRDEFLGLSDREIITQAVVRHGTGADARIEELLELRGTRYAQRVAEHSPITADALELVETLADHRIPVGIVTGAQRADVETVLAASPAGPFIAALVTEEDVERGKPDPEGYLAGSRLLRRRPSDVLVFEDSVPGVQAALAARMHCIAVSPDPTPELRTVAPALVTSLSADIVAGALRAKAGV